jgi:hypothetical protein
MNHISVAHLLVILLGLALPMAGGSVVSCIFIVLIRLRMKTNKKKKKASVGVPSEAKIKQ